MTSELAKKQSNKPANPSDLRESAALARPLADLVAATLQAAGRSLNTQRAYQTGIGYFLQFLDQEKLTGAYLAWRPLASVTSENLIDKRNRAYKKNQWEFRGTAAVLRLVDASLVDGYRNWREQVGDSPNAASLRVYAVRTFLSVAFRDGILTQEQATALNLKAYKQRQIHDTQPVGRRLSKAEVKRLRGCVDTTKNKGKRDLAILDTMLYAGLRCQEVADLAGSNFRQDGGRWWMVLTGKGKKTRRVKVHDCLYKSLSDWCEASGLSLGNGGCLFQSVNKNDKIAGQCVNTGTINRLVALYGSLAELAPAVGENRLSPHDLRRTQARNAYDNGASLLLIQAQLGHSDPKTTARYIGAFESDDNTATDYVRY